MDPTPISEFLDRNIFHAAREDLTPAPAEQPQNDGVVDLNACDRSQMAAGLIATVVAKTPEESMAVFDDRGKKETISLRAGEKLLDEAELVSIEWRRVLVKHNGRCEEFSLEEEDPNKPTMAANVPPPDNPGVTPGGEGAPMDTDLGKNVKKVSESEYEIPRSDIEGVLSNLNMVATQARIVPSFNNG